MATDMNPIIEQLHATLNALRAEWEGLSERRRAALLSGNRDALLDAEVRKIQIPYEAVSACTQAVHARLAELEAEARDLEAERDTLAEQLRAFEPEVRALWERIRPVQERYLRIRNAGHNATLYTIAWRASDMFPAQPESRLQQIYQMEIPRCKRAIEWLERLTQQVAAQEEQAVGEAVQLLYGVAPPPTEKILQFLQFRHLQHSIARHSVAEAGAVQHPAPAAVAEPSREPRVRIKRREGVMEGEAPSANTAGAAAAVAAAE
jgi:DNA repair exonuclease SbcCD ATPase subunit